MSQNILNTFAQSHSCMNPKEEVFLTVLLGLLSQYFERVADASKIFALLQARGDRVINDHIAFRSVDMRPLLRIFLFYGYEVQLDSSGLPFNFAASNKKLTALWLRHPNATFPRLFISQIRLADIHPQAADLAQHYLAQSEDPLADLDLMDAVAVIDYLHTRKWPKISYDHYHHLLGHSEYLAWVLLNDYYLNHFTVTVNALKSFGFMQAWQDHCDQPELLPDLYQAHMQRFNAYLLDQGFHLNAPQDKSLQISPDGLLLQSSTQAALIETTFACAIVAKIPGSYVEFAYRGLLPASSVALQHNQLSWEDLERQHLREGFETQNANAIFESTYLGKAEASDPVANAADSFEADAAKLLTYLAAL